MPYKIVKSGNKFKVQKKDGSRTFGTHPSRKKAQKQIAALHANVKESFYTKYSFIMNKFVNENKNVRK